MCFACQFRDASQFYYASEFQATIKLTGEADSPEGIDH